MTDLDFEHPETGGRRKGRVGKRSFVMDRMWKIRQPMARHLEIENPAHHFRLRLREGVEVFPAQAIGQPFLAAAGEEFANVTLDGEHVRIVADDEGVTAI